MRDIRMSLLEKFGTSKKDTSDNEYLKPSGYVYRIPKFDGTEKVITVKLS